MLTRPVRLGVLGWPISHSYSPVMQGAALRVLGLPWDYAAFAVDPCGPEDNLKDAILGARALGLRGLNITMPHKNLALSLCQPDELALRARAVNTLLLLPDAEGGVRGTNTDIHGFEQLCREAGVALWPGLRAVVLGAGGAARAVVAVLVGEGASFTVAARQGRELPLLPDGGPVTILPLQRETIAPLLPRCDLLVDCTPRGIGSSLGLGGTRASLEQTHPELDLSLLPPHAVVLDLVVRQQTLLTRSALALGLRALAGEIMLLHQGIRALEFWLGRALPEEARTAMGEALHSAIIRP